MIATLRARVRRRGWPRVAFEVLCVVQVLHLGEHVAQMLQLHVLGWPPAVARGVVSNLDVEKVHFVWNFGVLAALAWLLARGQRSGWLVATFAWAALHTSEHGFLLTRALLGGVEGAPGILGAGGVLARHGWDVPGLTTWSRATVHFAWNTVEVVLLCVAYLAAVDPRVQSLRTPAWRHAGPRSLLALSLLIPSTAGAVVDHVTALAPVEIWVDGFGYAGGIAIDRDDNLFVADRDRGTVTRVARDRRRTVVASGLDRPMGLAFDGAGRLLIAEEGAERVVRLETNGSRTPLVTRIRHPRWLAVSDAGVLYISARRAPGAAEDDDPMTVLALRPGGRLDVFADDFKQLEALAVDNGFLFVAARGRHGDAGSDGVVFRIAVAADGTAGTITTHGPRDRFKRPVGLARDHLGALYLTTPELETPRPKAKDAVAKLHGTGSVTLFAMDLRDPRSLAFDGEGHLYVADGRVGRVLRFRAPPPPALATLPEVTSQPSITVRGTTEARARTDLAVNDAATLLGGVADAAGKFAIIAPLTPNAPNTLAVFATPHLGDGLTSAAAEAGVSHDGGAPTLQFKSPAAGGFVRGGVTVQAEGADGGSGVASITLSTGVAALPTTLAPSPPAAAITATAAWDTTGVADGTHTLSATVTDRAGNTQTATRAVIVDNTAPDTQIISGPSGDVAETAATFTFTGNDNLAPAANLTFAWRLDGAAFGPFSTSATAGVSGLGEGLHTFEVKARDVAGNQDPTPAVRSFTVRIGPSVDTLAPSTGPVGTLVTITGSGFVPDATQVSFDGVAAVVHSVTPTIVAATVPLGARSGPVAVTTPRGAGTSAQPFLVTLSQDFAVHTMPATAQLVQGTSTTYTISLVGQSAPFTGLATLSITGLPSGVTGVISPAPTASGSQIRTLTLTATSSAALGPAPLTISAGATLDGAGITRTAPVTVDVIAGGRTAALGQVTFPDGTPIAGVRSTLAGASATTDAGGNFRLLDVPAGPQMLGVDANAAQAGLPIYGVEVSLAAGQATQLAPFRITPPPPAGHFVPIANGAAAQVVSDPRFPGASITLPAGVTITGWDGTAKSRIAIERLSPDALPVPPPPGVTRSLYQVFFGTPMGGLPSAPLPVTVPNDQDLEPGEKAEIWYYDAAPLPGVPAGWRLAGLGTVSPDGSRVVSDPGVGLSRFCGVCGLFCIVRNLLKQLSLNLWGPRAAEPVDLGSGLMIVDKTDLVVPGRVPAIVRRTYNPLDPFGHVAGFELATGPGWTLTIDVVLLQESLSLRRLILPGNARFAFTVQPDGTFTNGTLAGAVLRAHPDGTHTLRFKDGSTWRFATGYVPRVGPAVPIAGIYLLVAQSDRNGNTLTITRDRFGAPSQVTEPGGRTLSFTVDVVDTGVGRLAAVTDPIGRTVRYGYSTTAPFRLETVTDPAGGVTRYTYSATGGIVGITDPRGIAFITNEYDADGRVVRQTQADGGVWTLAYTGSVGAHTSATVTDPRGHPTIYRLDNAGFGSETIDALGQVTRRERDAAGRVTATTDPLGRVTRAAYDAVGNVTRITDADGSARTFTYEPAFNRVTSATDPLGQVTRLEYDAGGNLTAIVDPLGRQRTFTHNSAGQPLTATDPLGNVTRFEYDTAGNLTATIDPLGNRTVREYDAVSRVTRLIDALGQRTSMGYDFLNRVETVLDALGGVTRFAYDGNGNLLTVTDPRGSVTTHTYDTMDRLATRTDPVGARESFVWDPLGNPIRRTDRKGQVALFTHDALNRRTRDTHADATLELVYDAGGRLVSAIDSAGGTVLNRYDAMDRLLGQTTALGDVTYAYDSLGRRTTMAASGQPPVAYSYDGASRLTSITQASRSVQFQHDAAGRRTRLLLPNQASTEYQYDVAGRLTGLSHDTVAGPLGTLAYHYDPAGNVIAKGGSLARTLLPAPMTSAAYDAADRYLSRDGVSLAHDANGNLTADGTTSYTWDARNRLSSLSAAGRTATFTYDPLGRRTHKVIDGVATRLHYDGPNPVQLFSGTGSVASILTGLAIDEFFTITEAASQQTLLTDLLGSTIAELDQGGSVSAEHTYDPFGLTSTTGSSRSPFQYTARENDGTGLYHHRARYYSPTLHRFISEDPLGLRDGTNRYTYTRNRPTIATDPMGLLTIIVHGISAGRPNAGYSGELGRALIDAGETVVEVRWNGNPFSVEGTSAVIQSIVEAAQRATQLGEPLNIIGHSWGSVLAANALASTGITVENLVTLGSPLSNYAAFPTGANNWMNIGSPFDPISWGAFKLPAQQLHTWLYHLGYWDDPGTVAAVVGRITGRK